MINSLQSFTGVESVVKAGSGAESEFETETRKQIKNHIKRNQYDSQSPFKDLDQIINAINNLGKRVEDIEENLDIKLTDDKVTTDDVPSKEGESLNSSATLADVIVEVNRMIKRLMIKRLN